MSRKVNLAPVHLINAHTMGATFQSSPVYIGLEDSVAVQLNFTGSPVGTFQIQGSLDYVPANSNSTSAPNAGNWASLTLSPVPTAAGAPDTILLDLYALSFPYIRIQYTFTSGSGTLNAYVSCKALGS
jgi:hypothetical protein